MFVVVSRLKYAIMNVDSLSLREKVPRGITELQEFWIVSLQQIIIFLSEYVFHIPHSENAIPKRLLVMGTSCIGNDSMVFKCGFFYSHLEMVILPLQLCIQTAIVVRTTMALIASSRCVVLL